MSVIYEPKGKAREYSPLACNLYLQCTHGCKYCYAPAAMQRKRENYFCMPEPRKNVLANLERELKKESPKKQVLLSFIGDVYSESSDNNETTRKALELFNRYRAPVAVLTKGGNRSLKDIDVFKSFGEHFQFGETLTFLDCKKSLEWEPGAAEPEERLEVLKTIHDEGIKTFVSFEPVLDAEESLKLIKRTLDDNSVDIYKIGKINHFRGIDKQIDWEKFLIQALDMIRTAHKRVYVKYDLRIAAHNVKLYGNEVLADDFCVN